MSFKRRSVFLFSPRIDRHRCRQPQGRRPAGLLLYHGANNTAYVVPMTKEGAAWKVAAWKVAALEPTAFP